MTENDQAIVVADPDVCVGSGNCTIVAPSLFDLDGEGAVIVLRDRVSGGDREAAVAAAAGCPAAAIIVEG
ncbi:ferredoxin [Dactylosporangium sp. CA-092794]|uniref:ferredoxin n=1 Tax=Dactylosporangium sp. CA-092794 TaxID=3239929 RepID=UPI003D91AC5D